MMYCMMLSNLIYLYLSLSISIYLYLSLSIYLSISIYLYESLSISIYLYLSLSISIYVYLSLSIYLYPSLSVYLPWYLHLCASWVPIVASSVAHFSCRGQRCHVLEAPLFLQTNITSDDNKQKGNRNTASCSHFITFWRQLRCIHT